MQRLAIVAGLASLACAATPAQSADLDGPYVRERSDVIIERPAAPMVRERVIERHYYEPAPEYYAPRVYVPDPYADIYVERPYWARRAFFAYRPYWRHRHRHWDH